MVQKVAGIFWTVVCTGGKECEASRRQGLHACRIEMANLAADEHFKSAEPEVPGFVECLLVQ
jgi:hypothetical protein